MSGWLGFESPVDLLKKLERDCQKLIDNPADDDAARNFFVDAWSLVDWFNPNDKNARERIRTANPILQVCAHIADGSKHFELSNPNHCSVVNTARGGEWAERPFGLSPGQRPVSAGALFVHLDGEQAKNFGLFPSAAHLAKLVLQWFHEYTATRL